MGCCDDPTEPIKINRTDVARAQQQYGRLLRDLFTCNPEKVMLKQLNEANAYLIELAALNAHYDAVRIQAIELLEKAGIPVLQQIVNKEPESKIGLCAQQRIDYLKTDHGLFNKIFR